MDELKEIERKIVTAQSMADLRKLFDKMISNTVITKEQSETLIINMPWVPNE